MVAVLGTAVLRKMGGGQDSWIQAIGGLKMKALQHLGVHPLRRQGVCVCLYPSARRASAGTQGSKHLVDEVLSLSMETSLGNSDTQYLFSKVRYSLVFCHCMSEE